MDRLQSISVKGFKSIRDQSIDLSPITVLVGPNAAGRSNFVSLFKMLGFMVTGSFQEFIGRSGGADSLLHYGAKRTPQIEVELEYQADSVTDRYKMRVVHVPKDTLMFAEEYVEYHRDTYPQPHRVDLKPGTHETGLIEKAKESDTAAVILGILRRCGWYQFHDTSSEAKIRNKGYIGDNSYLRSDAGNLAAFLYMLQEAHAEDYRLIIQTLRRVAPPFHDFYLEPDRLDSSSIMLRWRGKDSDYLFGPHQLSDGFLRFAALTTLFLQPSRYRQPLIVIDEPELGLHPAAISILASMCYSVSHESQIILATQSVTLVNEFDVESIIVVEHDGKETALSRPDPANLEAWLRDYSLGEIWEKNVIGGRP